MATPQTGAFSPDGSPALRFGSCFSNSWSFCSFDGGFLQLHLMILLLILLASTSFNFWELSFVLFQSGALSSKTKLAFSFEKFPSPLSCLPGVTSPRALFQILCDAPQSRTRHSRPQYELFTWGGAGSIPGLPGPGEPAGL